MTIFILATILAIIMPIITIVIAYISFMVGLQLGKSPEKTPDVKFIVREAKSALRIGQEPTGASFMGDDDEIEETDYEKILEDGLTKLQKGDE